LYYRLGDLDTATRGLGARRGLVMGVVGGASAGGAESHGLIGAIGVLRERWWVVLCSVVVCVAVSLGLTLRATKQYTATAKLLFAQNPLIAEVGGSAPASADPQADQATNLLLVTTGEVAAAVKRALRTPLSVSQLLDAVSTSSDQASNIVDVSATDSVPARAARIADAFATEYVALSKNANLQDILSGEQQITQQLKTLAQTPGNAATRASLEAALQKLQTLAAVQAGNAQVVDFASVPTSPSSPNKKVNLVVALVFGLALGVGLAFLLNLLDRRLKTVEDFEDVYGTGALATIPRMRRRGLGVLDPAAVEQFLILRSGLSVLTPGREARVVLVTSAVASEGKTTVAIGLARAAASTGQTVVLVETDFKRTALRTRLGVSGDPRGLTTALLGEVDPSSLRSPVPGVPNLLVMGSGPKPASSAAVLRSAEMGRLLEQLASDADLVVLDAPPLLPVADAQALLNQPQIDAHLIVGRVNFTKRDQARYTHQRLEQRGLGGMGLVVNAVERLPVGGYYTPRRPNRLSVGGRRRSSDLGVPVDLEVPSGRLGTSKRDGARAGVIVHATEAHNQASQRQ